jgi:iron complex outermembrane receptor protein
VYYPVHVGNGIEGRTWGVEAWGSYDVTDWWRLSAGASTLDKDFQVKSGHIDAAGLSSTGDDPDYQASLRSQMTLNRFDVDLAVRHVAELPSPHVDAYTEADARVGWRVNDDMEFAVGGGSLLDDAHMEAPEDRLARRNLYAELRWGF